MFTQARLKLTAWYLLIVMLISISFSIAIYKVLTNELDRIERIQRFRQEHQIPEFSQRPPRTLVLDPDLVEEARNRLRAILILVNLGILAASSLAGYFLAGRTLQPIKQMLDEQNRFITDASHELRTPLTSLKSEIEVNLRDKKLNKQTKAILESNLEEVNRLQMLSDDLIKLTQYQKKGNIFEKISLVPLTEEAVKKVSALAKHKHITIKNLVKDHSLKADRQSLVEMLVIFLDNAIKYSPKKTDVTISSQKTDHHLVIEIKDVGEGIKTEDLPHIFDRFYRADRSRTPNKVAGYGLGLSIAKQIVEQHHGDIKVESRPNFGTSFFIHLPG